MKSITLLLADDHTLMRDALGAALEQTGGMQIVAVADTASQTVQLAQHAVVERPKALTPREWEVLKLIAASHTNTEIASELAIAVKTANCHVGHILAKLHFSSRRDVIAWVAAIRLFPL